MYIHFALIEVNMHAQKSSKNSTLKIALSLGLFGLLMIVNLLEGYEARWFDILVWIMAMITMVGLLYLLLRELNRMDASIMKEITSPDGVVVAAIQVQTIRGRRFSDVRYNMQNSIIFAGLNRAIHW